MPYPKNYFMMFQTVFRLYRRWFACRKHLYINGLPEIPNENFEQTQQTKLNILYLKCKKFVSWFGQRVCIRIMFFYGRTSCCCSSGSNITRSTEEHHVAVPQVRTSLGLRKNIMLLFLRFEHH